MRFDLQLFAELNLTNQTSAQLRKGIRTFQKRIAEHLAKINHPWIIYSDWFSEPAKQRGRLKHWQKEIEDFEQSIQNRIDELAKRGELP